MMSPVEVSDFVKTEFDFLIVGGGTAGLVLASRLSDKPHIQVGVIEAGQIRLDDLKVKSPTGSSQMLGDPNYDWNFKSIPQVRGHDIVWHD